jgi:hypothetical protein
MVGISPGWAIELTGDRIDLDDFRESLKAPFSPWIEDYSTEDGVKPLLRSETWANLFEASDVFRDATRMIERLNGEALLLHNDARPVKLGQTMKFDLDGKREPIIFEATGHLRITLGRVRGRATAITNNPPQPPQESNMQKWFGEAELDETLADLFSHINRANNWYDLYKSAELARRLAGGPRTLKKALSSDWEKWDRIWRTANCYRHAPDPIKFPLPTPPAELDEAREFILTIVPRLL